MRKTLTRLLLVLSAITTSVCAARSASPIPDDVLEDQLAYRGPHVEAFRTVRAKNSPYFLLTQDGTGYLKTFALSFVKSERPSSVPAKIIEGAFPSDWWTRPSFLKPDSGWTKITMESAQTLWGASKERYASAYHFYTFDVHSEFNGEANIYHVDLEFDQNRMATAYRIRGIGLNNAKWTRP